ncbi:FAS1 domain-containing protein [Lachnellula occidentalis]|uniref:FAS1 domain-containing protein n=1 Tax=Lachnellula occidentalis TaxID=215460 RepID=A0A8H8S890_9HELO|nr:FAS1 domain-containing protein [Lachnellula occidentalis]
MRYTSLIYPILTISLASTAYARNKQQHPINSPLLTPAMPPPSSSTSTPGGDSTVILSDVLGNDRSINIFAGFTRDFAPISKRFEDSSLNTTILAPINSAIMGLPRKPWEDLEDYDKLGAEAYEGGDGQDRAQRNLRRFVEAHVVPASPWKEGEKLKTLAGGEIWWESRDGGKVIQPGNIEVSSIASKVHNGEVWILKGVRNYASQ